MDRPFPHSWHRALRYLAFVALLFSLFNIGRLPAARAASGPQQASFILDGVHLSVQAFALPSGTFMAAEPGSASQVATSASWRPFREFEVTAIPFGSRAGTEALPATAPGSDELYRAALRDYRIQQGAQVVDGPLATLFGRQVTGLHSFVLLNIDGPQPVPVSIDEWVVEAGERLWIVRSSQEQLEGDLSAQAAGLDGPTLTSSTLDQPTTVQDQPPGAGADSLAEGLAAAALPAPSWWQGDCDLTTYTQGSGGRASYRLGEVYQGLPACGPRPYSDSAPDVLVRFYGGSWGEYEWECVELAMRFMYLMYGITPYQANGSQVVWNYAGTRLVKIANGTAGQAPQPNDILSYGATSTYGHTAVVTSSGVDANGNGTLTVIEQNSSASGRNTLTVSNWTVAAYSGSISGWLHDPSADATPTSTPTPSDTPIPTDTPTPGDTPTPTATPDTVTISGNAGKAGAVLSYVDGAPKTVSADGSGNYAFSVPYNWSGTVKPSLSGVTFLPSSRDYGGLSLDQAGQDYEVLLTKTYSSTGSADGTLLETSETSGQGGNVNSSATTFKIGDTALDKQYRAIVSFSTSTLPDNAVLVSATLKLKRYSVTGTDPFSTHGNLLGDIRTGAFSGSTTLQSGDFQAAASKNAALTFTSNLVSNWYSTALAQGDLGYVNKTGVTQFRLRFALDDNDDLGADQLICYSGNATSTYRPQLIIRYYVP